MLHTMSSDILLGLSMLFMAQGEQLELAGNLYSSSPEERQRGTGVTTALVINHTRHLCVYLSLSALLFSISSMPHLQLSQQAAKRRQFWTELLFKCRFSRVSSCSDSLTEKRDASEGSAFMFVFYLYSFYWNNR